MDEQKKIGVLTSGGDAPGMNAAVRAVVRTGLYYGHTIFGIKRGYQGLIEGDIEQLNRASVGNIIREGGTFLRTARCTEFLSTQGRTKAFESLQKFGISDLIVVGGDGSFRGLHALISEFPVHGLGLPGTIDNDLFGTDYTIGFDTAVNTALHAIDKIRDTATSHSRLFLIEVMGRRSGYIGLYSGIGGGAEEVLIPETATDVEYLYAKLEKAQERGKKSIIIVVTERDEARNVFDLKEKLEKRFPWDVRISILGHQQRGGDPTAFDRMLASKLGYEAVLAVMQGESDKMVGLVENQVTLTPLEETWLRKKEIDPAYLAMAEILAT